MKKLETKKIFSADNYNTDSALWQHKGFAVYKADGKWNYTNGTVSNWEIDGQPFNTRREAIKYLEAYLKVTA